MILLTELDWKERNQIFTAHKGNGYNQFIASILLLTGYTNIHFITNRFKISIPEQKHLQRSRSQMKFKADHPLSSLNGSIFFTSYTSS